MQGFFGAYASKNFIIEHDSKFALFPCLERARGVCSNGDRSVKSVLVVLGTETIPAGTPSTTETIAF